MSFWRHKEAGLDVRELGGFELLYADPSWRYRNQGGRGAADNHYRTMSLAELTLLPIEKLAAENAALFMWCVWPQLFEAGALMKAWGFEYLNCGFVWVKTNKLEVTTDFFGQGYYTRGNSEFCLFGRRGKPKRVDATVRQIVLDDTIISPHTGEHSEKPAVVRDRILQLLGDVSAIELFARTKDPRFDVWGNEVLQTVELVPELEAA